MSSTRQKHPYLYGTSCSAPGCDVGVLIAEDVACDYVGVANSLQQLAVVVEHVGGVAVQVGDLRAGVEAQHVRQQSSARSCGSLHTPTCVQMPAAEKQSQCTLAVTQQSPCECAPGCAW